MNTSHPLNFAHQDLRNRSFQGKNLNGADFSGADIRGCDFSNASLQGANFQGVRAGQNREKFIVLLVVAVVVAIAQAYAISYMIFGVLGQTPEDPAWVYSQALIISMSIAGVSSAISSLMRSKSILQRIAITVSGSASGALLGFFYGGSAAGGENAQIASASALMGAVVIALASFYFTKVLAVPIAVAGSIAAYGLAFFISTVASAYLSTNNFVWGIVWSTLSLGAIVLTIISLIQALKIMTSSCVTNFRGADLTKAKFDTNFVGAIGYQ
ncbi:pentapeptide repeat-containing protein [Iningainema tapete]|uniref:Pentapeptide repeat-containing protein n=1 Tax=Iningainema tapete BLCC-T55 TaxID=2748662 RepID=A0A8J6XJ18_9CYAN|nr:pentapeptide repeat-containing protein [Iningainema tapete]MBD2776904.1 pentapeptide repeat-containing protein [Iningainema tapete BLCC-T55]